MFIMVIDRAVNIKKDQFWFHIDFSFIPFISRVFFNIIIQKVFLPANRLDEIPILPTKTNSVFPHTTAIRASKEEYDAAPFTEETQKTVGRNAPKKSHRVKGSFGF
ncbi:UNVERIFIED_CONTAM: hypothetical protein FO487_16595 [Bacillus amyloliquefaciens DSM 7 = ATCC 23350]|nr:hypothetical protein LL3_01559 [Bacillus amyloliquefaciens LL3]AEK89147.1 hypothetical protein BAXH7_02015 [Bacillus amyloliquefaciens XH7]MDR4376849.1 hypothetical protein [Bacillus amyloliquefaciens]OXL22746.1 hypothetical protein CFI04_01580 [Bacillus amyloliquefaciens]QDP91867.1 hypothetical protein FOG69_06985 [Bacillus amyloliquefaciens]